MHADQIVQQCLGLLGEGVLGSVPRAVKPPDLTGRTTVVERVQHSQHRRHTDARADENDRPLSDVEDEQTAWGSDFYLVADAEVGADVLAGGAVRFDLDTDPVGGIPR